MGSTGADGIHTRLVPLYVAPGMPACFFLRPGADRDPSRAPPLTRETAPPARRAFAKSTPSAVATAALPWKQKWCLLHPADPWTSEEKYQRPTRCDASFDGAAQMTKLSLDRLRGAGMMQSLVPPEESTSPSTAWLQQVFSSVRSLIEINQAGFGAIMAGTFKREAGGTVNEEAGGNSHGHPGKR